MVSKVKRILFTLIILGIISSSFSYVYSPRVVSGNFEIQAEYSNLKNFDLVILINPNWNVSYIKIYGDKPVKEEVLIKNLYGEKFLAIHLKYINLTRTKIHIGVSPSEDGTIRVYEVYDQSFKRTIIPIKKADNSYIIPIILGSLPLFTFMLERNKNNKKIKRKRRK